MFGNKPMIVQKRTPEAAGILLGAGSNPVSPTTPSKGGRRDLRSRMKALKSSTDLTLFSLRSFLRSRVKLNLLEIFHFSTEVYTIFLTLPQKDNLRLDYTSAKFRLFPFTMFIWGIFIFVQK
jgi:hypothetical protein